MEYRGNKSKISKGKDKNFDIYLGLLTYERSSRDEVAQREKINSILEEFLGIDYDEFIKRSKPEEISEGAYEKFGGRIRRKLFSARSRLILSSLEDYRKMGGDVISMLETMRGKQIPYLIKKGDCPEPTVERIYRAFKQKTR